MMTPDWRIYDVDNATASSPSITVKRRVQEIHHELNNSRDTKAIIDDTEHIIKKITLHTEAGDLAAIEHSLWDLKGITNILKNKLIYLDKENQKKDKALDDKTEQINEQISTVLKGSETILILHKEVDDLSEKLGFSKRNKNSSLLARKVMKIKR